MPTVSWTGNPKKLTPMSSRTYALCALLLLASSACGTNAFSRDASTPDPSRPDAAIDERDGGVDAGTSDGGPPDSDHDGVADTEDCAPHDPTVGLTSSRHCTTACGEGTEICEGGDWAPCNASLACLCDAPGERRIVQCGLCGEQSEECTDGRWQPVSACLSEGPCVPGTVERQELARCRVDERLCSPECTWGDWETVVPYGECTPGERTCDAARNLDRVCTVECAWTDNPDCDVNP